MDWRNRQWTEKTVDKYVERHVLKKDNNMEEEKEEEKNKSNFIEHLIDI